MHFKLPRKLQYTLLAFQLLQCAAHAQAPTGTTLICAEICTLSSTTGTAVVYQFGAGGKFNTVANPTYPLLVDCNVACPQVGGDPAEGVQKAIYAVQQTTAYTVKVAGVAAPVPVPAMPVVVLAPPVNPPPPATQPVGFTVQFTCTFAAGSMVPTSCTTTVGPAPSGIPQANIIGVPNSLGMIEWSSTDNWIAGPTRIPCPKISGIVTGGICYAD